VIYHLAIFYSPKYNFDPIPKIVGFSYSQRLSNVSAIDLKNLSYIYASPEMLKKTLMKKLTLKFRNHYLRAADWQASLC
jgi:hypothetical protein